MDSNNFATADGQKCQIYITLARPEKQDVADRIDREFVAVWKD